MADGFAGVFPEHKYEIVKRLQERKHICGMTGDRVNDAPTLKKASIGIVVADAPDAARGASDIVLTEFGLKQSLIKGILSRARGRLLITSPSSIYAVQWGSQKLLLRWITNT